MKSKSIFSLVLLTVFLLLTSVSCNNDSQDPLDIDNDNKGLVLNDTAQIFENDYLYNSKYKLKLEYDSLIQDCRCPVNVVCIWAGYASVQLKLTIADETPVSFALATFPFAGTPQDTVFDGFRYKLLNCLPFPGLEDKAGNRILVTVTQVE